MVCENTVSKEVSSCLFFAILNSSYILFPGFHTFIDESLIYIHIAIFSCPILAVLRSRVFLRLQKLFPKNIRFSLAAFSSALLRVYERENSTSVDRKSVV